MNTRVWPLGGGLGEGGVPPQASPCREGGSEWCHALGIGVVSNSLAGAYAETGLGAYLMAIGTLFTPWQFWGARGVGAAGANLPSHGGGS